MTRSGDRGAYRRQRVDHDVEVVLVGCSISGRVSMVTVSTR
jgi:hypothetical protein